MNRATKAGLLVLAGLILVLVAAFVFLATFDWNRARPWLNEKVSQASVRPLGINGDLRLAWHRPETEESGWRARLPWPHFSATDITMGNPEWARSGPRMASVGRTEFSVNPFALLGRRIQIPTIILRQPDLVLERDADGRNNWTFKQSDDRASWKMELGRVQLTEGRVRLLDAQREADITSNLDSLDQTDDAGYQMRWTLKGKLEGESLQGNGRAGPLLALREMDKPYPIEAQLRVGGSRLAVSGTVARPRSKPALDLRLDLSGPSLAKLPPIISVLLPETSAYATRGHLKGQLDEGGGHWTYENFTGRIGQSDIAGSLEFDGGKARPRLAGKLESRLLRFEDLGSLIGAKPEDARRRERRGERLLPEKEFDTRRWRQLDADVQFIGHRIQRSEDLPIDNLQTHLKLQDGLLRLQPLNFGVAGGQLNTEILLNGREQPMKAELNMQAKALQLNKLFPSVESMHGSVGKIHGQAKLTGAGNSVAALLGSANGELKAMMDRGRISKFMLEAIGLNVGSMVVTRLFGDRQVSINCTVADFAVERGVMKTRAFVMDAEEAVVNVRGQVNLGREQLNLTVHPESRNLRLFSLRSPLYVTGSFRKPDIGVDKATLAAKAGGAVALAVLAPVVTALLPLSATGDPEPDAGCASLMAQAKKTPQAPPPPKR